MHVSSSCCKCGFSNQIIASSQNHPYFSLLCHKICIWFFFVFLPFFFLHTSKVSAEHTVILHFHGATAANSAKILSLGAFLGRNQKYMGCDIHTFQHRSWLMTNTIPRAQRSREKSLQTTKRFDRRIKQWIKSMP